MVEERLALPHAVLVGAEEVESIPEEIIEQLPGVRWSHGEVECAAFAGVMTESTLNKVHHLQRQVIGRKTGKGRELGQTPGWRAPAVLGVVVPAASNRRPSPIHQDGVPSPHPTIEILHDGTSPVGGEIPVLLKGAVEVGVRKR